MEHLKYPIGKASVYEAYNENTINKLIKEIEDFPYLFEQKAKSLSKSQLHSCYRPGGWTGLQVIHHVADSHINAYIRFKMSLTEENPVIKPYDENLWAHLPDGNSEDISMSLDLLKLVHKRWAIVLRNMSEKDFNKSYVHPQYGKTVCLFNALSTYAWHGNHHLSHLCLL